MARVLATPLLALMLISAAGAETARPAAPFTIESFFAGKTFGRGFVKPLVGARQDFTSTFTGRQEGATFVLEERFAFADGRRPSQTWRLKRVAPDRYEGTVDWATSAVTAKFMRNGVAIDYDGRAPGGDGPVLHFRHEMTQNPDGTVTNRVSVSKAGLRVARSLVRFAKTRGALRAERADR